MSGDQIGNNWENEANNGGLGCGFMQAFFGF